MTELYNKIKKRREELGLSQDELSLKMGYKSRSSINKIETGKADIPQSKIKAFANALETTTSYLMGWDETFQDNITLTKKDNKEIFSILETTKEQLLNQEGLLFDGEPATPEAIQSILDAMQVGMEIAKTRNKEKYTPNKYKK